MTLFRVRGVPIRVHWTLLLLGAMALGWEAMAGGLGAAGDSLLLGLCLFGSVALHEAGHAWAAARVGVATHSITLFPFGGVAALEGEPRTPSAQAFVAVAGPLTNLGLAGMGGVLFALGSPLAAPIIVINLAMAVFNMIPAYPMDGGRVFRAFRMRRTGTVGATLDALSLGRWMAWAMVFLGVLAAPSLVLVGGFLLFAQAGERRRWQAVAARLRDSRQAVGSAVRRGLFAHPLPAGPQSFR